MCEDVLEMLCGFLGNIIHTYIHTYIYTYIHTYISLCRPGREDLLKMLCGFLGKGRLREFKDFLSKKHPSSLKYVP
jgi:hypothetical protein